MEATQPPSTRKTTDPTSPESPLSSTPAAAGSDSSTASAAAPPSGHEFVVDGGPEHDVEASPAAPELELEDEALDPDAGWDAQVVRELLESQGELLHALDPVARHDDELWRHTERDLNRIAGPATRILNRYDTTRAMGVFGDEVSLIGSLSMYVSRNTIRRRRLLAQLRAGQEPEPVSGVRADPDAPGPETDPEWRRVHGDALPRPSLRPRGA